jgi:hypothetical protein
MDSVRSLLDELDEELDALVRLVGNVADLLLLVRSERILGALGVCEGRDCEGANKETHNPAQKYGS